MKSRIVSKVMYKNYKNVEYTFIAKKGEVNYKDIKWLNDKQKPDEPTLEALVSDFENEEKKNEYQKIRENGNWDNFTLEILEEAEIDNRCDLTNIEKNYIKNLKPNLNTFIYKNF